MGVAVGEPVWLCSPVDQPREAQNSTQQQIAHPQVLDSPRVFPLLSLLPFVAREAAGNPFPQKHLAIASGRQADGATIRTRYGDVGRAGRVVKDQLSFITPNAQAGDSAHATVEVIEPREEFTENLVRHVGLQGQLHALTLRLCPSHAKKSAIELTILEAAGQHVDHVCFQAALTWVGGIHDR